MNFYYISVSTLCIILSTVCGINGTPCTTPKNEKGVCQHISDCGVIRELLYKKPLNDEDREILRLSAFACPQESYVCCPVCYTIDGRIGTCGNFTRSPYLSDWSKLRKSWCYKHDYLVCNEITTPQTRLGSEIKDRQCNNTLSWFPPDEDSGCCGQEAVSSSRIAGGTNTSLEQHPWLAIIKYKHSQLQFCGGALISNRYVLTAAHCVNSKKRPVSVILGEYDRSRNPDCFTIEGVKDCNDPVEIGIESVTVYPKYDENDIYYRHDIALITLARPAPYTDFIHPICLPTGYQDITEAPPPNFKLLAAGWGATDQLGIPSMVKQQVELKFVNGRDCSRDYLKLPTPIELWSAQMCAGSHHKDSCQGDSGGPLVYAMGSTHQVLGVVSAGVGKCGEHDLPGIYTKVWYYDAWIRSNMKPWDS